jgi:hypothetical protein
MPCVHSTFFDTQATARGAPVRARLTSGWQAHSLCGLQHCVAVQLLWLHSVLLALFTGRRSRPSHNATKVAQAARPCRFASVSPRRHAMATHIAGGSRCGPCRCGWGTAATAHTANAGEGEHCAS